MTVYDTNHRRDPFKHITTEELMELRGYRCEARGPQCTGRGCQAHHGLRRRDTRFQTVLNVLINYQLVCEVCHTGTGYADSKENHEKFLQMQRDRYGDNVDTFFEMCEMAGMYL